MSKKKKPAKRRPNSKRLADEIQQLPEDQMEVKLLELKEQDPVLSARVMEALGLDWDEPEAEEVLEQEQEVEETPSEPESAVSEEEAFQLEQEQEVIKGVEATQPESTGVPTEACETMEEALQRILRNLYLLETPARAAFLADLKTINAELYGSVRKEMEVHAAAATSRKEPESPTEETPEVLEEQKQPETPLDTSDRHRRQRKFRRDRPDKSRYAKRFSR